MSSKPPHNPNSSESSDRQPLPFEPAKNRKQAERKAEQKAVKKPGAATKQPTQATKSTYQPKPAYKSATGIPETVSRRMVKRMAVFCGLPTLLGMSTFVISYLVLINDLYEVPTYAVLLVSLGFFGLGVLGLSYGALSASWDEDAPGSRLGFAEFAANWGRMTGAWKAQREAERKNPE